MRIGPQTGAGDGNKDYKAMSDHRRLQTGARYLDEQKKEKARIKLAKRVAKQAAKAAKKG